MKFLLKFLMLTAAIVFLLTACADHNVSPPTSPTATPKEKPNQDTQEKKAKNEKTRPCWIEHPQCEQAPEFAFFTGLATGEWPVRVLRKGAVTDAQSQLGEYLETKIESETWQQVICGKRRCEQKAGKRVVASAMLRIRGRDFKIVGEHSDPQSFYVRIRIPQGFLEKRLKQAARNP